MKKRTSRLVSTLLILCIAPALLPGTALAADGPEKTSNRNRQNYSALASTISSYLYENEDGGLTRVEHIKGDDRNKIPDKPYLVPNYTFCGKIVVEDYDSSFRFFSGQEIPVELDIWGGFFAGESFNFFVFGQLNEEEDNDKEVVRVVKYSKDWQRLGQASLYGANTVTPFVAGSLRFAEYDGELYIRTCHEMYALTSAGVHHQANMTVAVRESDMEITDSYYRVRNSDYGYVSHSLNQFVIVDRQQCIVTLDHGDASPRSAVLMVYDTKAGEGKFSGTVFGVEIQGLPGAVGYTTNVSLGGLAETAGGYVVAYNFDSTDDTGRGNGKTRNVYFAYVEKDSLRTTTKAISGVGTTTPVLAPTGLDGGYILWNSCDDNGIGMDTLYYAAYSDGGSVGVVRTATAALSDCQPIVYNGKVVWYTTNNSTPTFYQLDENGVTAVEAGTPAETGTLSGISVTVNGVAVPFPDAKPFIDANDRTMVPLRAVGDAMELEVNWDAAAREASFTGSGKTIIFPIDSSTARTSEGSTVTMDTAAVIVSERTYAPVRYLAQYFGYEVGWDAGTRTVVITR